MELVPVERVANVRKIITTIDEAVDIVTRHLGQTFAFDVETTGLKYRKDELLGLALYFDDGNAYYFPLKHTMPTWDGLYQKVFISSVAFRDTFLPLFSQVDVLMIAHNAKFDMHFLHRYGVYVKGRLADTLLAAQLLDENRANDLKSLAVNELGMEHAKYDTLASYPGFKKKEFLGVPLDKGALYAMNDVEATYRLWKKFHVQMENEVFRDISLLDIYNDVWMPLLVVLQQMEERGIALDIEKVREMHAEYTKVAEESEKMVRQAGLRMVTEKYAAEDIPPLYTKIATEEVLESAYENNQGQLVVDQDGIEIPIITYDMVGKTSRTQPRMVVFNTGSSKQMTELVFEHSNLDLPTELKLKQKKDGTLSADKDNLSLLLFYTQEKAPAYVKHALTWRKAEKFITTYLNRFLNDSDADDYHALHTWFAMAVDDSGKGGTRTGRLSSRAPNLQNIPSRGEIGKDARSLFIARPHYKLLVADLGQAELRMLAHYSMDEELIKAFEEERDLHILTGAGFARMDYEELKALYDAGDSKAKDLRMLGKTGNFALTYGMGAFKFQRRLIVDNDYEITIEQAKDWINGYNEKYIGATIWKQRLKVYAKKNGYIVTFGGRKRRVPNITHPDRGKSSYAERQAINAIIQGSVGDIIEESMLPIQKALKGLNGTLLLQVHDELVAEVPEENALLAKEIMETMMVRACNKTLRVPQIAEAKIGDSWAEAKG